MITVSPSEIVRTASTSLLAGLVLVVLLGVGCAPQPAVASTDLPNETVPALTEADCNCTNAAVLAHTPQPSPKKVLAPDTDTDPTYPVASYTASLATSLLPVFALPVLPSPPPRPTPGDWPVDLARGQL